MSRAVASSVVALGLLAAERDPDRMGADWVPVLEQLPLFQGVRRRHLRRIPARSKRFPPGAVIVRAGEQGDAFYVILDGTVRVNPSTGRLATLKAGDSFGEMALLDGAPRSADIVAVGEVLVMTIGRSAFAKLLRKEPQITQALLRTLAARLREAERQY